MIKENSLLILNQERISFRLSCDLSIKADPEKNEPIWHSDWASTTFLIPENNL